MEKKENIFKAEMQKETVFLNRQIITPHYTPEKLPFREKQISEIVSILSISLKQQKPDNLFLYGKTGTGKTATTKLVLKQLNEFAEEQKKEVKTTYMNCRNFNSKYKAITKILGLFYPEKDFLGYSAAFVYEKMLSFIQEKNSQIIVVLDEIDKIKDLDELVYTLTRANDDLKQGGITIIGISNQLNLKDRLDPRTKSSLCEKEMVFPPYNAQELKAILKDRISKAFKKNVVQESAIALTSAIASKEAGDARTAVMLLLRAGEIADETNSKKVTDKEVEKAKTNVEEEIMFNMISTLPKQEQLVLHTIASLTLQSKGIKKLSGEEGILFSGQIYDEYVSNAKKYSEKPVSQRWFRQYIGELSMYGLIQSTASGKGQRGNTRLIKLGFDAKRIRKLLEEEFEKY